VSHPKITLFSVHKDAMAAAVDAFARDWPEAQTDNLLDDGLFRWVGETKGVVPGMYEPFEAHTRYMVERGADAILFTCSAFQPCIDAVMSRHAIPMLKPNDAMIEQALDTASRVAVLATVAGTIPSVSAEIEAMARARGQAITLSQHYVEDAFDTMAAGDGESHDAMVANEARTITEADVIVLAQFTLSRAVPAVSQVTDIPVLNSPGAAVAKLKGILND
jgi:aspartate/glutamate racemase